MLASFAEYFFEWYLFPSWFKQWSFLTTLGMSARRDFTIIAIMIAVAGQVLRTTAMITAGSNFTHLVAETKEDHHVLVKTGIYSVLRHPSYTGFFYWALALQVILFNPICFVLYVVALKQFFADRIVNEEHALIRFFGDDYLDYRQRTFVLIPGNKDF